MSEKAAKVQRKALNDLQKVWRTTAQDHFKRSQEFASEEKEHNAKLQLENRRKINLCVLT